MNSSALLRARSALSAIVGRALEGEHVWGRVDVTRSSRLLCASYRLVVYPPGTNGAERRRLTNYRNWPVAGSVLALAVFVTMGAIMGEPLALGIAISVYLVGFVVSGRSSRPLRDRSRTVDASFVVEVDGTTSAGNPALLAATMRRFHELELAYRRGSSTPAQFEARWADIYYSLDRAGLPTTKDR